jgi:O-succinylbenzoic acid--CoA ligase
MRELIALVLPGSPRFVDELRRAWDDGDAVLPVDTRLPEAARDRLLDAMAPAVVVDEHGTRSRRAGARPVEAGDALVMATSGTTGDPKGVVLTHDAVAASARASSARLGVDPGRHRWLACLPVAHVGGLSVITRSIVTGTPCDLLPGFDVASVEAAADRGVTHVSLVATALRRIDPARFERILLGGAAAPADLPGNCVVTDGMTETGSGIVYDHHPLDGVELRIVDGEIQVRGPMLLRAYRDGTDPRTPDGWLPTGDEGVLDADGRLEVFGRRSELIITGGQNVWPVPVEAVLATHPAVADVLVTGRPDPEWGQVVTAVVVPADPAAPPTLDELRDHGRAQLASYALPRALELATELPRTALGKLRRTG